MFEGRDRKGYFSFFAQSAYSGTIIPTVPSFKRKDGGVEGGALGSSEDNILIKVKKV